MCLRFVFLLITRIAEWLRLSRHEEAWKTAEILILRHQLAVLQRRQPHRPKLNWADRALIATLLSVIPRARRHSVVLVDQPADGGPAVDPGSHVDDLAWVVYRRAKGPASVRTVMVVVAVELGKDGAQVPFTVDQQMVKALSA